MKRQEQKEGTQKKILEEATRLFMERGYEQVTMRMLATEIGLSPGAIYVHFPNKHSLLVNILFDKLQHQVARARKLVYGKKGFSSKLLYLTEFFYTFYLETPELSRAMLREIFLREERRESFINEQHREYRKFLIQLIDHSKENGEVRKDVDSALLADAYFAIYFSGLVELLSGHGKFELFLYMRHWKRLIDKVLLRGLLTA